MSCSTDVPYSPITDDSDAEEDGVIEELCDDSGDDKEVVEKDVIDALCLRFHF